MEIRTYPRSPGYVELFEDGQNSVDINIFSASNTI